MTDREKFIIQRIDELTEKCIKYMESKHLVIPNIGSFNIDLVVLTFIMETLLKERDFKGQSMQKFVLFYEKHYISNRCNVLRKKTVTSVENDEIDSKNLIAYFKFEKFDYNEKRQYFIRTLSNISSDINKFVESTKNFSESSKIHFPFLTLINIYVNPLFCYEIPVENYNKEISFFSYDIKNSNIDLNKFLVTFSKMWSEVINGFLEHNDMFLDSIELNFPEAVSEKRHFEKVQNKTNTTKNNSGCMLLFSIIILLSVFSFLI